MAFLLVVKKYFKRNETNLGKRHSKFIRPTYFIELNQTNNLITNLTCLYRRKYEHLSCIYALEKLGLGQKVVVSVFRSK